MWTVTSVVVTLLGVFQHPVTAARPTSRHYHAGHAPYHTTRLSRLEHEGMDSLFQIEEGWRNKILQPQATDAAKKFTRLSSRQVKWLRRHHQSMLDDNEFSEFGEGQGLAHGGQNGIMGLSSLSTQYVGPVGVGTRMVPRECNENGIEGGAFAELQSGNEVNTCQPEAQSKLWVVFDTGSTNMWISSDLCKRGSCVQRGRKRFEHGKSGTFAWPKKNKSLRVHFGTGMLSGPLATEDFRVGPFTVHNQTFAMIQKQGGGHAFKKVPLEGIVGLGFPALGNRMGTAFFDNVIQQKALSRNEFAFYVHRTNPAANAIFWGGVDPAFYQGRIEYFPINDPYFWSTRLHAFKVGKRTLLGGTESRRKRMANKRHGSTSSSRKDFQGDSLAETRDESVSPLRIKPARAASAILDTGTTHFTAEPGLWEKIMKLLPKRKCSLITAKSHPTISFTMENSAGGLRDFTFTHSEYMVSDHKRKMCHPAFMKINIPKKHGPGMILGELFFKYYLTVFDRGNGSSESARLGIAPSQQDPATTKRLRHLTKGQQSFAEERKHVLIHGRPVRRT